MSCKFSQSSSQLSTIIIISSSGIYRRPERILTDSPTEWMDSAGKNPPGGILMGDTPISLPL